MQLVLEQTVALLHSHVDRIGYHRYLPLIHRMLSEGVFRSLRHRATPTLLPLILLRVIGRKKRFQDGCCLFGQRVEIREFYALHVILLGLVRAFHFRQRHFLEGGLLDGPECLEQVLVVVVVGQFVLDTPERRWWAQGIPLKAFRRMGLFEEDDGATGSTTARLFFLKRLGRTALCPPLDFLLGDTLDDLALVEEGQRLPLFLPRSADQRLYGALFGHVQSNLLSAHLPNKSISQSTQDPIGANLWGNRAGPRVCGLGWFGCL
jgi:hypothetical protein